MNFRVNGRPVRSLTGPVAPSPGWEKLRRYLERLPNGSLLSQTELARVSGHDPSFISRLAQRYDHDERYHLRPSQVRVYWGNPRTIREAKAHYADDPQRSEKRSKR